MTRQQDLRKSSRRLEDLQAENRKLKAINRELNIDLMRAQAKLSDAEDKLRRWEVELEIVGSKTGHNGCHIWIPELLRNTLGNTGNFLDPDKMTPEQFAEGCVAYHGDRFGNCNVKLVVFKSDQK